MIKKSVFEDELIAGMQYELREHDQKQGINDLVKAAEYLHSAVEIFEEAGMTAKADQVLNILAKIAAASTHVRKIPSLQSLMDAGVTIEDLKNAGSGDPISKARVNLALRSLGLPDKEIIEFVGHKNMMSEQEAKELLNPERAYSKINKWFKDPTTPIDPKDLRPGEEIVFKSIAEELGLSDDQDAKGKSHKPTAVSDKHTHGLTSEKMLENLKNHGIVFNLADSGAADDLLDADIRDDSLEVFEGGHDEKTFEDSD